MRLPFVILIAVEKDINLKITRGKLITWGILSASVLFTTALFIYFASQLDLEDSRLAFDWKIYWNAFQGDEVRYKDGMFNPPWSVAFILPLTFLSLSASLGLMMFFTLAVLLLSVPRHRNSGRYFAALFLLLTSFPVLRNFGDMNLQAYVISGLFIIIYAYQKQNPFLLAVGIVMASMKPQEVSLVMIGVALYTLQTFPFKETIKTGLTILLFVIASMLLLNGEEWLETISSRGYGGIAPAKTLPEIGIPLPLIQVCLFFILIISCYVLYRGNRKLSREKIGLMALTSMITAPYIYNHSIVTVLVLLIIPLFLEVPFAGLIFLIAADLPLPYILAEPNKEHTWLPLYWSVYMLAVWVLTIWRAYQAENSVQIAV